MARAERAQGRWDEALARQHRARQLDPRSWEGEIQLGATLLRLRRTGEAREAFDRGLVLAPANLHLIMYKATSFLQEGDLTGARAVMAAASKEVEPTALVAYFATFGDRDWVLDDAQRDVLLRLTPGGFDENRGTWGIALAQASARRGDQAKVREYAEEARMALAAQVEEDPRHHVLLGLALAYLGRKAEAVREGERSVALLPIAKDSFAGAYQQHQLVRIHILVGNHEKARTSWSPC